MDTPATTGHPGWPLRFEYEASKRIALQDLPFYALVMAAMRQADTENLARLRLGFEDVWQELQARYEAPGGLLPGEPRMSALVGPAHAEQVAYLRRVYDAQPAHRARAEAVAQMDELRRNLVLLELAELAPAAMLRAVETVTALGCLACAHPPHEPGDCLQALVVDGTDTYCVCGAPR